MVWTFTISKCPNHEGDCANFCGLLRKAENYQFQNLSFASPGKHVPILQDFFWWEMIDKTAMQHDESRCFVNEKQNSVVHTAIYKD